MRIGIDLGGTKIEGVVIEGDKTAPKIIDRQRILTEADHGYKHIISRVAALYDSLSPSAPNAPIGVGMPGSVTRAGRVKNSNTVCLNGTAFRPELVERLKREVTFANDANCFTLAEALLGAAKGFDTVFGIIMGTGVGGGLVLNGVLREGPQSICGEWGHMTLDPTSEIECYCGKNGCVELYLSGPRIEEQYRLLGGGEADLSTIVKRCALQEDAAKRCIEDMLDRFGRSVADIINLLDPDIIVLGGGVSNVDSLYNKGYERIERYIFSDELTTKVVRNQLGDSAGVLGAALLV